MFNKFVSLFRKKPASRENVNVDSSGQAKAEEKGLAPTLSYDDMLRLIRTSLIGQPSVIDLKSVCL
jgi:hypothetical protein